MARTDAQNCEFLREAYDKLIDAIVLNPNGPIEIEIRGRTVRYTEPTVALERLEKAVARCEQRNTANTKRSARNRVRLMRDGGS